MRVRDENVPELKLFGGNAIQNRFRVQAGVKQRRLALDFIPDEIAIHGQAFACRGEHADFAPDGTNPFARAASRWRWLRVLRIQANQRRKFGKLIFAR